VRDLYVVQCAIKDSTPPPSHQWPPCIESARLLCHVLQAAEYADQNTEIAAASAAVLYPCTGAPSPEDLYALLASPTAAAAAGKQDDDASAAAAYPLFNPRALQCWLLRACQQLKGGLRDKPGKSADYYHSCYCLSGLATAQHIAGGGVVGPAQNAMPRVDPLLNVLAEKLQQAKEHFGALPKLE
jgi:protein farnesyltransferase subunit beta